MPIFQIRRKISDIIFIDIDIEPTKIIIFGNGYLVCVIRLISEYAGIFVLQTSSHICEH